MKLFSIVATLMSVTLASAATVSSDKSPVSNLPGDCFWTGTAPFCDAFCPVGTIDCGTFSGDGPCPYRKYCCYGICSWPMTMTQSDT